MENLPIKLELRKLGLSEKEVGVYLAGLELGPNSVQKIAQMAQLSRPTAYEIIKKLEEKRLFLETGKKGKRVFSAQSPENILGILRTQKREIEEKEREFIRIIATLESNYSKDEKVKAFKDKEGLKALEEILSFSSTPEILLVNPDKNPMASGLLRKSSPAIKKRLGKVQIKELNFHELNASLIVFDKVIFLPAKKQKGYLIGN